MIRRVSLSFVAWTGAVLFYLFAIFYGARWENAKVIDQDVISYYSYLPAAVIHGDLGMSYAIGDSFYKDKVWGVYNEEDGTFTQKMTMGMAILYLPFFLIAHLLALAFGFPAHGYSTPYLIGLQLSSWVFFAAGLWLLRNMLVKRFGEWPAALTLAALAFATNLFYYVAGDAAMPHAYLFFLIVLFMRLTERWHDRMDMRSTLYLGICGGLIILIRPVHIWIWLLPLLYDLKGEGALLRRVNLFLREWRKVLLWPACAILIFLPQMLYWKAYAGTFMYWSYGEEGFFWVSPQFVDVLFSFRKGWLIYTPVMMLSLVGLAWLYREARDWFWPVLAGFLFVTYTLAAWWCWWFGGSFGHRAFIDIYGPLSFGMAALFAVWGKLMWRKVMLAGLVGLLALLNLFQTWQYTEDMIHYDSMNAAAYAAVFLKTSPPEGYEHMLTPPDYDAAVKGIER